MTDKIQIGDKWYVAAGATHNDQSPQVLKHEQTFGLFDRFGDIPSLGGGEHGLYHNDTRYLSQLELLLDGARPLFLGSTVREDNSLLAVDLMNPDSAGIPKGHLHLFRGKLLWRDACYEHVRVTNHSGVPVSVTVSFAFQADFIDLFQVRGMQRDVGGDRQPDTVGSNSVRLPYRGLDGQLRQTCVDFEPAPTRLSPHQAEFALQLAPGEERHLYSTVRCDTPPEPGAPPVPAPAPQHYDAAFLGSTAERSAAQRQRCRIETSNPLVNQWIERSVADVAMLTTTLPSGPYPYAGVPWYSTTFGRDGILTARELLWVDPSLARGVLAFLAETQAQADEPARDAEPGKILHEARLGEMANTREIPFGRYYGTVDATPLFVGLAGAYFRRTGDLAFVRILWPNVLAALRWIDLQSDADGFVCYRRKSDDGLVQQGWKDSQDSIFHADGQLAEAPIALCEVQGYVFEAKLMAAEMARAVGDDPLAVRLQQEAERLRERFAAAFWCEELGSYAIALDGAKRRCAVHSSNAGHALWSGIALPEHAARIAEHMLGERFHNGWGIRTIASGQARYNPMSYHNGSVWPHDNALIAAGMARYGHTALAMQVLSGLFDATLHFEHGRLPELFCGFPRRDGEGPVLYPVACSPQAWASAALFSLLQSCLGLDIDVARRTVSLRGPQLPSFIDWLTVERLAVGPGNVDLRIQRYHHNVGVEATRKTGPVEVAVVI